MSVEEFDPEIGLDKALAVVDAIERLIGNLPDKDHGFVVSKIIGRMLGQHRDPLARYVNLGLLFAEIVRRMDEECDPENDTRTTLN